MTEAEIRFLRTKTRSELRKGYEPMLKAGRITQVQYDTLVGYGLVDTAEELAKEFGGEVVDTSAFFRTYDQVKEVIINASTEVEKYNAFYKAKAIFERLTF